MNELNSGNLFDTNFISLSSSDWIVSNNRGSQMVCGFSGPSMGQGSNYNAQQSYIHDAGSDRISDSYALGNLHQPEKDSFPVGILSYEVSYPATDINQVHQDSYMEPMPISAASIASLLVARFDTHENPEQCASAASPFLYPLELPKSIVPNANYDTFTSSFSQNNIRYDGGLLSEANCNWANGNFSCHEELAGIVGGRTQQSRFFDCSSGLSNELSLSLATSSNHMVLRGSSIQKQNSELCCSDSSPYERCMGSDQTSSSRNLGLSFGSNMPVQISHLISGSRYTKVMQGILAELAAYSLGNLDLTSTSATENGGRSILSSSSSCNAEKGYPETDSDYFLDDVSWRVMNRVDGPVNQSREIEKKKKQLLDLLQVVDDRYNECLAEVHTVLSAFHAVTALNPPIHARFFLQTISFLYKNLRERISNYILAMGAYSSQGVTRKDENSFEASFIQKQWALQQMKRKDNQLWRPQRGLPEKSVSVLRTWLFQNFLHPYPKDAEKHLLAVKSGLSRSQVSNWFINARVRLWKPMIEEMYSEMNRRRSQQNDEEPSRNSQQRNRVSMDNHRFNVH